MVVHQELSEKTLNVEIRILLFMDLTSLDIVIVGCTFCAASTTGKGWNASFVLSYLLISELKDIRFLGGSSIEFPSGLSSLAEGEEGLFL